MVFGFTPFLAATKEERFDKIQYEKIKFPNRSYLTDSDKKLCDLIEKLLHKDPSKRLGGGREDYQEVLKHPLFQNISIDKIISKEFSPSFKP